MHRVIGLIREGSELLRMVEHIGYHDLPVLPGRLGVAEHLCDVVLVHRHGVAAWHPLVEVALGHRPALGVHPGGELDPSLGTGGSALLGGRDKLVPVSHLNLS